MYLEVKISGDPAKEDCLSKEAIEKATETLADYMRMIRVSAATSTLKDGYGEIMQMAATIKLSTNQQ